MSTANAKPVDYADIRIAGDGAVLIAVDYAGLVDEDVVFIKKKNGEVFILQQGRVRARIKIPLQELYNKISADTEIVVCQVSTDGSIQVLEQVRFK